MLSSTHVVMFSRVIALASVVIMVLSTPDLIAQQEPLKGRVAVELHLGMWNEARAAHEVGMGSMMSTARSNGFLGNVAFSYWPHEEYALSFSVGVLSGEANQSVNFAQVSQRASSVIPIMVHLRYYFIHVFPESSIRPFVTMGMGPYLGYESSNSVLVQETRSESTMGGHVGGGLELYPGKHLKLGVQAGYHGMMDFTRSIGARRNYNGMDFLFNVGIVL